MNPLRDLQTTFLHLMGWVASIQTVLVVVVAVAAVMFALYIVSQL